MQHLDPNLEWSTFRLTGFGFNNLAYTLSGKNPFYTAQIDLTATKGYVVDVSAGVDVATGIVTWHFDTIDPATGLAPADPTKGFLPVNDASNGGEGYVSYTIQAKAGVQTGDVVGAQATVVFDNQPPINTPAITDTLVADAPTSAVQALPAQTDDPTFQVAWSGQDDPKGPGIATYTVYVSEDGGPATPWLSGTTRTDALFTGQTGHAYAFSSIATDNVGNTEAQHRTPDTTVIVSQLVQPGPTVAAGTLTIGHGQQVDLSDLVHGLVTPGASGDTETVTALGASNGTASIGKNGVLSYVAPAGGTDAVSFTVTDQRGHAVAGAVDVTVDSGPDVRLSVPAKVARGKTLQVGTAAPGLAGDALTLTTTKAGAGALALSNGVLTYTAPASGGPDSVGYTITDQLGDIASGTVGVSVDPGPVAATGSLTVGHGKTASLTSLVNELVTPGLVGDTETVTVVSATSGQAGLAASTGAISYVAPASGADTITYTLADQLGDTATGTVSVTVDPGPTAGSGTLLIGHNKARDLTAFLNGLVTPGLAGDAETVTAVSTGADTAALGAGGAVSYAAPASGSDALTYTVADQLGDTATGTVAITVDPGPVLTPATVAKVGHGQAVRVGTVAPDLAGDTLALTITSAGRGALGLTGGMLTYAAPAAGGADAIGYAVTDQLGDVVTGTFSTAVDAGPTVAAGSLTVGHGKTANLTSLVQGLVTPGLAGDAETVTAVSATSGQASLDAGTGAISYVTPASGSDTVTYAVADQLGDAATGTVAVTVDPGPAAGALSRTTPLGSSVNLTSAILGAATPGLQGDTLAITGDGTAGTLGMVSLASGQLTYTASGSGLQDIPQNGTMSDSFAYTVSDQYGDAASGTVSLTVTNPTPKLLTTSSSGSLQDAAGNTWTLTTGGDVDENGAPVPDGSNTAQLTIANNVEYALDAQGSGWYTYSPATQSWTGSAPPPGLYPPSTLKGLTPGSGGSLKDAAGNTWTLTSDGTVNENGTPVPDGANTAGFTIFNNAKYGLDASGTGWYTYAPATQTWTSAATPTITIAQSVTSATISMGSVLVNAAAGNHTLFIGGSNNTLTLAGGTETITDLGGANTYVVPAAGKGYDAFTTNVLNLNDVLDLRPALKATNWTGTASTLSKYLSVADSSQGATLSISATSGGAKTAIALIEGATTTNLSTLLTHAITK